MKNKEKRGKDIKILFLYKHNRSFVKRDLEMLKKHFTVIPCFFSWKKLFILPFLIIKADIIFIWFVSYYAFLATIFAKLFSKKVIVVTGGYDVAGEKEINYGLMLNPLLKKLVKFTLKNSHRILAVSKFNKKEIEKYLGIKNAEVLYNTIDHKKFTPLGKKEKIVITVGFISENNIKRKGLETFVKAAKYLPTVKFFLIGKPLDDSISYLRKISPKNVVFTGFVSDEELLRYYQRAKVYCQLSYYESFGMAPAEAMLCECIPVVTNRGALPEVVGDAGFYVPYGDEKATAETIKKALEAPEMLGKNARKRILKLFPYESREKKLVYIIREMMEMKK